jgi:tetratricopeptide (TPR) repeat protein
MKKQMIAGSPLIHRSPFIVYRLFLPAALTLFTASCAPSPAPTKPAGPPPALTAANQALAYGRSEAQRGNVAGADRYADEAISDAGSYLSASPYGPEAAEAFYLQGRGYELKVSSGPTERMGNMAQARSAYQLALGRSPSPALEGNIRASLSNVTFFQDDFAAAIDQATQASKLVDSGEVKGLLLFRIGVCQQRLGEFTNADYTFNQVMQRYPGSGVAEAAREHAGQREFYIQLATYPSPEAAEKELTRLRSSGAIITRRSDAQGHTIADIGPFSTYQDAKKSKDSLGNGFPDALIVP